MAVDRNAVREERERGIFSEFAQSVGLPVVAGSLQSRPPPEPDVLCEIQGRGPVAFELVELIDQDFQERTAVLGRFNRLLRAYPDELSPVDRGAFLQKYANAAIGVTFRPLRLRDLQAALPELFRWLRVDVRPTANSLDLDRPPALRTAFERIAVRRPMPHLDLSATRAGYLEDPTFGAVHEKLHDKQYTTCHPIELLAYTTIDLLLPLDVWQATYEQPLRDLLNGSTFQRIWVFSLGQPGELKFVHPPL